MLRNSSHLMARSAGGDLMLSWLLMSLMAKTYPITNHVQTLVGNKRIMEGLGVTLVYSASNSPSMLIEDSELSCHLHIALENLNI